MTDPAIMVATNRKAVARPRTADAHSVLIRPPMRPDRQANWPLAVTASRDPQTISQPHRAACREQNARRLQMPTPVRTGRCIASNSALPATNGTLLRRRLDPRTGMTELAGGRATAFAEKPSKPGAGMAGAEGLRSANRRIRQGAAKAAFVEYPSGCGCYRCAKEMQPIHFNRRRLPAFGRRSATGRTAR